MWIPMASPESLWKEALAHGITCLPSSLLTAPSSGHWQHRGDLGQQQEQPHFMILPPWMMIL